MSQEIFSEFEDRAYKHLVTSIEAQNDRVVQEILKSFLKKIHRRKK
jgi:farnesyl diphosphate synthase